MYMFHIFFFLVGGKYDERKKEKMRKKGVGGRERKNNKGKNSDKILFFRREIYIFSPNLYGKNIILKKGEGDKYDFLGKHVPLDQSPSNSIFIWIFWLFIQGWILIFNSYFCPPPFLESYSFPKGNLLLWVGEKYTPLYSLETKILVSQLFAQGAIKQSFQWNVS